MKSNIGFIKSKDMKVLVWGGSKFEHNMQPEGKE